MDLKHTILFFELKDLMGQRVLSDLIVNKLEQPGVCLEKLVAEIEEQSGIPYDGNDMFDFVMEYVDIVDLVDALEEFGEDVERIVYELHKTNLEENRDLL